MVCVVWRVAWYCVGVLALACALGAESQSGSPSGQGVTAHRGNSADQPENTMAAFRSGIEAGCDWLELDVYRTKDGRLAVIHDKDTGRVGDKKLVVADSTYAELLTVDVATDFRQRKAKTVQECPAQRIPLLEDVLRLVMAQKRTRVSIQPKMDCVEQAITLVKQLGAEAWVGFNDGKLELMAAVKRLAPSIPVFWDRHRSDVDEDIRIARQHRFEALVLHHSTASAEKFAKIKAAGIEPGAWTVNDPILMRRLLDIGVQRVYTDAPRQLMAVKAARQFQAVQCEGFYRKHLQGVCTNDRDAIYWCFTDALVKTDAKGRVLKQVPVASHHGDLCFHAGRLYVAVNLGRFNQPAGKADSWIYVYDAESLKEVARHKTPEPVHGAGGIAYHDGRFLVVGGLPIGTDENYLYEYDESLRFVKRNVLASAYTLMGIQTAAFIDGHWWFGCYGKPAILLKADTSFRLVGKYEFDCSLGIVGLPDGRILVARGLRGPDKKSLTARLVFAEADKDKGLVVRPARESQTN